MNRRFTGLLAWCALGLVVAIPSTDVLLKATGDALSDSDRAAALEAANRVGPQLADRETRPVIVLGADVATPVSQPFLPIDQEPDVEIGVAVNVPPPTKALPTIVPLSAKPVEEIDVAATPKGVVELNSDPISASKITPVAPLDMGQSEKGVASEVAVEPNLLEMDGGVPVQENLEVAAIEPVEVPIVENRSAPVPMPADLRPKPVVTSRATSQDIERGTPELEEGVRSSVNVIEVSRRPVVDLEEPVNQPFWGDNPQYRNGRRLDSFGSDEVVRADDASDSAFYELWEKENRPAGFRSRGSFSEQLPARRGSAIRLDLLQNQ